MKGVVKFLSLDGRGCPSLTGAGEGGKRDFLRFLKLLKRTP
jgi:hypothetical protein